MLSRFDDFHDRNPFKTYLLLLSGVTSVGLLSFVLYNAISGNYKGSSISAIACFGCSMFAEEMYRHLKRNIINPVDDDVVDVELGGGGLLN